MPSENSFQHGFRRAYERDRQREHYRRGRPVAGLIGGLLIAAWGFALLLNNLGLDALRQYADRTWPAVFVIIGITLLIHRDPSRNRYGFWGTVWVFAGACAYVSQQGWIHANFWSLVVPMLFVLLGARFVYRGLRRARPDADARLNAKLGRRSCLP